MRLSITAALIAATFLLTACSSVPVPAANAGAPSVPATPIQTQPATPTQTQPATPTQTQPATPTQTQPATPTQTQPATSTQTQPTTPTQTQPATPTQTQPVPREIPSPVRGIHLSGWIAGSPSILDPLLSWAKSVGINTVVLEIKAEDGRVSWISDVPLAEEIGANTRKVGDIAKLVGQLHDQGIWVAGRIVVMNDAYLYQARPAWAIPGFSGTAYSFMDPKNEHVWRYNIDLAKSALKVGFDEIQFDYVRYPEKLIDGFNRDTTPEFRAGNITGFLKQAVQELKPLGAVISADVFGLTTSVPSGDDMKIGQDYRQIIEVVDYISPMVYPSHYDANTYGIPNPDANPYETVKQSMTRALERTTGIPVEKHRPWIQDFTYPAAGAAPYGKAQVLDQVRALRELGIDSFMLWDPSNKYTRGLDYTIDPTL